MGSISRQINADRFIKEFGEEIAEVSSRDRGHKVTVAADFNGDVRMWVTVGDYEYMSDLVLYDPDFTETDDMEFLGNLLSVLGLEDTEESARKLQERLKRAEL